MNQSSSAWAGAAGALLGAGVAALSFRYLEMPFGGAGLRPGVLSLLGIAAMGAGWLAAKHAAPRVLGVLVMLVCAGAGGGLTWIALSQSSFAGVGVAELPLRTKKLHGFAIDLPTGQEKAELDNYEVGSIAVLQPGGLPGGIELRWDLGEAMTREELKDLLLQVTPGLEFIEFAEAKGKTSPIELSIYRIKGNFLFVSTRSCAGRNVYLISTLLGGKAQLQALHTRIVDSFACETSGDEPLSTKLSPSVQVPSGFGVDESVNDALVLVGLDGSAYGFYRNTVSVAEALSKDPAALKALLSAMSLGDVVVAPVPAEVTGPYGRRSIWRASATDGDQPLHIIATSWSCERTRLGYVAIYLGSAAGDSELPLQTLLSATCPQGSLNPGYPSAEEVFAAACEAGDERGCE